MNYIQVVAMGTELKIHHLLVMRVMDNCIEGIPTNGQLDLQNIQISFGSQSLCTWAWQQKLENMTLRFFFSFKAPGLPIESLKIPTQVWSEKKIDFWSISYIYWNSKLIYSSLAKNQQQQTSSSQQIVQNNKSLYTVFFSICLFPHN